MPLWNEHMAARQHSAPAGSFNEPPMPTGRLACTLEGLRSDNDFYSAEDDEDQEGLEQDALRAQWNQWLESTGRMAAVDRFLLAMPVSSGDQTSLQAMIDALADLTCSGFNPHRITWTWLPDGIVVNELHFPDCVASRAS